MTKINLISPKTQIFNLEFTKRIITPNIGERMLYAVIDITGTIGKSYYCVSKVKPIFRYREN